jgi:glycopeptide antibiotics resistance protein
MIFRNVPTIRMGHLVLKIGGADANGQANFVPFKTILPYIQQGMGSIMFGVNIIGNIVLPLPLGFLVPLVFRKMTWQKSIALAIIVPLFIEGMQVLLQMGIFDIDDVILNGLGVMIGFWIFILFEKLVRVQVRS